MTSRSRWLTLNSPAKALLTGGAALAGLYGALCGYLWLRQHQLIYATDRGVSATPAEKGLVFEEVYLLVPGREGQMQRVHGWWIPGTRERVMLYLHGNGFNIAANLEHAQHFHRLGFSVMLIDYRGFGNSDGKWPSETQMYEDALAAWKHLVEERQIDPLHIFIYGHSLGGAVAIDLASRVEAGGLIVEGTFTTLVEMASRERIYRMFPLNLLLHQRFDSVKKIRALRNPVLVIHGIEDAVVPFHMGERLYREAASALKRLLLVSGGGHENTPVVGGTQYLEEIESFVRAAADSRHFTQEQVA